MQLEELRQAVPKKEISGCSSAKFGGMQGGDVRVESGAGVFERAEVEHIAFVQLSEIVYRRHSFHGCVVDRLVYCTGTPGRRCNGGNGRIGWRWGAIGVAAAM